MIRRIEKCWNMKEDQAVVRVVSRHTCSAPVSNYYTTVPLHHHLLRHCHYYSPQEAVVLVGACCCTSFEAEADLDIHIVKDYFVASYVVDDDDSVTAVFVPTRSIGMLQTCLLLIASSLSICVE